MSISRGLKDFSDHAVLSTVCCGWLYPNLKLKTMTLKKIRIVRDSYSGYEVQVWYLWFPFWTQLGGTNTSSTIEGAREYANSFNQKTIKESRIVENVSKLTLKDLFEPPMTDEERKYFEEFLKEREAESIL